tara:strand:+ start:6085 stop:8034 length:1950 start_codon:yes stop_codon:yes gene_type:complete
MYILDCIPISRGVFANSLQYFTSKKILPGAIVRVPLRGKLVPALVISEKPVKTEKSDIRSYSYSIQKISTIESNTSFLPEFVEAVADTADYYAGYVSATLSALSSKYILDHMGETKQFKKNGAHKSGNKRTNKKVHEPSWEQKLFIQGAEKERLAYYKSKIREAFANKSSVFFCLPTIADIERISHEFEKGISKYTIILHSKLPKKVLLENWQKALDEKHPVLVIATGQFLLLPRQDIKTIIVDKESSGAYKQQVRPHIDIPKFIEFFAQRRKIGLVVGDIILTTESIYEKEAGLMHPASNVKYRFLTENKGVLIDMCKYRKKENFRIISKKLATALNETIKNSKQSFLYVARRGLAPYTLCDDCGALVLCDDCDGTLVLYKQPPYSTDKKIRATKTSFMCHKCGKMHSGSITCANCDSWRLTPLGVGIEKVKDELLELFPNIKIFVLDSTVATTHKKSLAIIKKFEETPGGVLLGTEMALAYLSEPVDTSAIVSIDPLFAIPDYRIRERILGVVMRTKVLGKNKFFIQTRNPTEEIFTAAIDGNVLRFYRDEIEDRKKFHYPPFTILIRITKEGPHEKTVAQMRALEERLSSYDPLLYPSHYKTRGMKKRIHLLLRIKASLWPDKNLLKLLQTLTPDFLTEVNPREIL